MDLFFKPLNQNFKVKQISQVDSILWQVSSHSAYMYRLMHMACELCEECKQTRKGAENCVEMM